MFSLANIYNKRVVHKLVDHKVVYHYDYLTEKIITPTKSSIRIRLLLATMR